MWYRDFWKVTCQISFISSTNWLYWFSKKKTQKKNTRWLLHFCEVISMKFIHVLTSSQIICITPKRSLSHASKGTERGLSQPSPIRLAQDKRNGNALTPTLYHQRTTPPTPNLFFLSSRPISFFNPPSFYPSVLLLLSVCYLLFHSD